MRRREDRARPAGASACRRRLRGADEAATLVDIILAGTAFVLAVSTHLDPHSGGLGLDGRHVAAVALLVILAARTITTKGPRHD